MISAKKAAEIDARLFKHYPLIQLIDIAGLAVADALYKVYHRSHRTQKLLVIAGPGNNGGDALSAARWLSIFGGFDVSIHYPKENKKQEFVFLVDQCRLHDITFLDTFKMDEYDLILDGIFGFGFISSTPIRHPFQEIIQQLNDTSAKIVSVDVPSGWDVDGNTGKEDGFAPALLVSLTAPKRCVLNTDTTATRHYLGGNFIDDGTRRIFKELEILPRLGREQAIDITEFVKEQQQKAAFIETGK